jgi:hypothetical protein
MAKELESKRGCITVMDRKAERNENLYKVQTHESHE